MCFKSHQECKVKPTIININSNEPLFYPYSIFVNECSGSCNNIYDPFAKLRFPDVIKGMDIKLYNIMSRINETRYVFWHETCTCKCKLNASVCNDKQRWNNDKYRCECKEFIDKVRCDDGFIWSPIICECECDKSCDVGEYLDYKNCKSRTNLIDNLNVR